MEGGAGPLPAESRGEEGLLRSGLALSRADQNTKKPKPSASLPEGKADSSDAAAQNVGFEMEDLSLKL